MLGDPAPVVNLVDGQLRPGLRPGELQFQVTVVVIDLRCPVWSSVNTTSGWKVHV